MPAAPTSRCRNWSRSWSGSCGGCATAGRRRTASRQGPPEGQPHARARQYLEAGCPSGAAGRSMTTARSSLDAMLDAIERVTEPDVARLGATAPGPRHASGLHRAGRRERADDSSPEQLGTRHNPALHQRGNGPHLDRAAPLRGVAPGGAGSGRRHGRSRAGAGRGGARYPAEGGLRRRAHRGDREDHPARRDRVHHVGGRARRPFRPLAPLRPDLVGCRRHRPGPPAGAGDGRDPAAGRRAALRHRCTCRRASPHADDRAHPRRPRRADDLRPQAGGVARPAGPRPGPAHACARGRARRQDLRAPSAPSRTSTRRWRPTSAGRLGLAPAPASPAR